MAPPQQGAAGDVDDAPEARAQHGGQHRLRALDGGAQIDGDHLIESGEIDLAELLNMIEAGIVDEPGHLVAPDDISERAFELISRRANRRAKTSPGNVASPLARAMPTMR